MITTFVLVLTPFLVYFTPWYAAGFSSVLVAQVTHVALMVPGFVFFWTLLRVDPVPKAYPYVVALWITAAEVIGDAVLGLAVIADTSLIAGPYYHALARPWGPSLATTQVLGGGVLWIVGDIVGLPFLAAQLIQMIREDEAEAQVIDAELDDAEPALAETGPAGAGQAATQRRGGRPTAGSRTGSARSTTRTSAPGRSSRLVAAADQEGPADGQVAALHELLRLQRAPRWQVGLGGRVVGEHLDRLADRDLPDPVRQHDDRDRALLAERVERERGLRRAGMRSWGGLPARSQGLAGARLGGAALAGHSSPPRPNHGTDGEVVAALTVSRTAATMRGKTSRNSSTDCALASRGSDTRTLPWVSAPIAAST